MHGEEKHIYDSIAAQLAIRDIITHVYLSQAKLRRIHHPGEAQKQKGRFPCAKTHQN